MSRKKNPTPFPLLEKAILILLAVMVFARIVIYLNYFLGREYYFFSDDAVYAILSKRFLSGDLWHAFHPYWSPGFPIATVPFYLISKSWENAQFLVSAFSATSLIIVVFWFNKRFSPLFALIMSFLTAFSISLQNLVISGGITEPLYLLLLWTGIFYGFLALTSTKHRFYIWSGVFFGLAYLTRTEAIALFSLFLTIVGVKLFITKQNIFKRFQQIVNCAGIAVLFFVLINLPYITFQSLQLKRLTLSGKYAFFGTGPFYALERDRPSTLAQDVWSTDYIDYSSPYFNPKRARDFMIKYFLNGTITQGARKTFIESLSIYKSENTNNFFTGFGLIIALMGFGLGIFVKKLRQLTLYLGTLWVGGLIWVSFFMAPHYRYLVFALPFFLYLQAITITSIAWISIWIAKRFKKQAATARLSVRTIGMMAMIFFLLDFLTKNTSLEAFIEKHPLGGNKDHKLIGDWIRMNGIKVIGGRMEAIPFYADSKLVYMPSSTPDEIVDYMKKWGVEFLLVRPDEVGYAHVAPIADPKFTHPDLTLMKQFHEGSIIWRIQLTKSQKLFNERIKRE